MIVAQHLRHRSVTFKLVAVAPVASGPRSSRCAAQVAETEQSGAPPLVTGHQQQADRGQRAERRVSAHVRLYSYCHISVDNP